LLKKELRRLNAEVDHAEIGEWFRYGSAEDLYAALGSGMVSIAQVAGRLSARQIAQDVSRGPAENVPPVSTGVNVLGVGDLLTRMAECCDPLPGDDITGFITRTRGVTVHKVDCPNTRNLAEPERIVAVTWGQSRNLFPVRINIECWDRVSLLHDITGATSVEHVNITSSHTEVTAGGTVTVHVTTQVANLEQLSRLFTRIEGVRGVRSVSRTLQKSVVTASSAKGDKSRR
jgi:GTP pyrophosphokinase